MDTKSIFDDFVRDVQTAFPNVTFDVSTNIEEAVSDIENNFFPHVIKIIKREPDFFSEARVILGINVSQLWSISETDEQKNIIWKNLIFCCIASLIHGDIKAKFSKILDIAKSIWNGSGQQNDEVTRILNDDKSESRLKELFDFLMETRIAKVFKEIVESLNPDDLEINIESHEQIMEILQNPEHPTIKRVIEKLQRILQEKLQRGHFTQQQFQQEIESIKVKITSVFGGVFNDMLGGERSSVPSSVLLGNSPEARRQRMMARLQKKVRDKK